MRFFWAILMFLTCCTPPLSQQDHLSIIIEIAQSYTYDLQKKEFTVHFMAKPDTMIKFSLSESELNKITKKYYERDLQKMSPNKIIEDNCLNSPKLYTVIKAGSEDLQQKISIDESCESFSPTDAVQAINVISFLKNLRELLDSKPEIKNNQTSDILYY